MALRLPKSIRKEIILKNSIEMIREEGLESLSIKAISIRCDCGVTTVKALFSSREALYRGIINYAEMIGDEEIVKLGRRIFPG